MSRQQHHQYPKTNMHSRFMNIIFALGIISNSIHKLTRSKRHTLVTKTKLKQTTQHTISQRMRARRATGHVGNSVGARIAKRNSEIPEP